MNWLATEPCDERPFLIRNLLIGVWICGNRMRINENRQSQSPVYDTFFNPDILIRYGNGDTVFHRSFISYWFLWKLHNYSLFSRFPKLFSLHIMLPWWFVPSFVTILIFSINHSEPYKLKLETKNQNLLPKTGKSTDKTKDITGLGVNMEVEKVKGNYWLTIFS